MYINMDLPVIIILFIKSLKTNMLTFLENVMTAIIKYTVSM